MESILTSIVAQKKQELSSLPDIKPAKRQGRPSFVDVVLSAHSALIAEVKPKSPSNGVLIQSEKIPKLVETYDKYAQAISVLCDKEFFGGGYELLAEVRSVTEKPLLAKDFIISKKQIDHVVHNGADAALLIAAILSTNEISELVSYAVGLGLDILMEVHTEEEIRKVAEAFEALPQETQRHILIGINNRDLDTLETDIGTTEKLVPFIKKHLPACRGTITESGIRTSGDIEQLQSLVQGFLIGTSILKSNDPEKYLASLFPSS